MMKCDDNNMTRIIKKKINRIKYITSNLTVTFPASS